MLKFICCSMLLALLACLSAVAVENPVLPHTADCGVMRFGGEYYLMGVGTAGGMWVSPDLAPWQGPKHAFSMENAWATGAAGQDVRIHACDMSLHGGVFHLYWSVNYGELRQIGHAVASNPLGPYHEPVSDTPFDGRIDPHLFMDRDGTLYFYSVKFPEGNVIYGQPMETPWKLTGEPKRLLSAIPGTWELQDHKVNEAPCAVRYRDEYYLLYNANHTATEYGHYAIGAAQASHPLAFTNKTKYLHPVLTDSPERRGDDGAPCVRNCGQPNLVRGPNGFEWWLVYFAIHDKGLARNQAIDRVHFLGTRLTVDGPTTAGTAGYHPSPAAPSFQDLFASAGGLENRWDVDGREWAIAEGELRHGPGPGLHTALAQHEPRTHYVCETAFRLDEGRAGLVVWECEGAQVLAGLDRDKGVWFVEKRGGEAAERHEVAVPAPFAWDGWHELRAEKDGSRLYLYLDGRAAPAKFDIIVPGAGTCGVFAADAQAAFTHFMCSAGWDSAGLGVQGWEVVQGGCASSAGGLQVTPKGERAVLVKGDAAESCEFSAHVMAEPSASSAAGILPVWIDKANCLAATVDAGRTALTVSGFRDGQPLAPVDVPIPEKALAMMKEEAGFTLRAVKLADRVILWVNGEETLTVPGLWPPSRVGLIAEGSCTFNYTTCFER